MQNQKVSSETKFVAKCDCVDADEDVRIGGAPREKKCLNCGKWIPFVEVRTEK